MITFHELGMILSYEGWDFEYKIEHSGILLNVPICSLNVIWNFNCYLNNSYFTFYVNANSPRRKQQFPQKYHIKAKCCRWIPYEIMSKKKKTIVNKYIVNLFNFHKLRAFHLEFQNASFKNLYCIHQIKS